MDTKKATAPTVKKLDPRLPSQITLEIVSNTIEEWKKTNTPELIKKKVLTILEQNSKEIVIKLLGFNDSWGKFELDHCNGRAGESEAGKYLAEQQRIVVKEWLSTVKMPALTATETESMLSGVKSDYMHAYQRQLRDLVMLAAKADAEKAFNELSAKFLMESIDKTHVLLGL